MKKIKPCKICGSIEEITNKRNGNIHCGYCLRLKKKRRLNAKSKNTI